MKKTILVLSDLHCGHMAGLTPPAYNKDDKLYNERQELWKWYQKTVRKIKPDIVIVNGDAIDGTGIKSGGREQLTTDPLKQVDMAIEALSIVTTKKWYMTYGCLTPGHRVLASDLTWVKVEELKEGDGLIGFDEYPNGNKKRKLRKSIVIKNELIKQPVYKLHISDGTTIEASDEHPFLVKTTNVGGGQGAYKWETVEEMYKKSINKDGKTRKGWSRLFKRFVEPWEEDRSYEAAWLSGFYDGEASLNQGTKRRNGALNDEYVFRVDVFQNPTLVLDRCLDYLKKLGFRSNIGKKAPGKERTCRSVGIKGGMMKTLEFLGRVRPLRLLQKFNPELLGCIKNRVEKDTYITNIEYIGVKTVCGLGTSTKTYIAEGFLCHNTAYHTGNGSDYEDIIAKEFGADISSHLYLPVGKININAKHHIGSSGIPHGRATAILREMMWNNMQSSEGKEQKADIIIRSHVHYNVAVQTPTCLGFTTPALQLPNSIYGERRCTGNIDIGMVVIEIDKDKYNYKTYIYGGV